MANILNQVIVQEAAPLPQLNGVEMREFFTAFDGEGGEGGEDGEDCSPISISSGGSGPVNRFVEEAALEAQLDERLRNPSLPTKSEQKFWSIFGLHPAQPSCSTSALQASIQPPSEQLASLHPPAVQPPAIQPPPVQPSTSSIVPTNDFLTGYEKFIKDNLKVFESMREVKKVCEGIDEEIRELEEKKRQLVKKRKLNMEKLSRLEKVAKNKMNERF